MLLTGFGPFPGIADNATARLVPALARAAEAALPAYTFHSGILQTAWSTAPERAVNLIATHRPALALHFGVAREANGFRIETRAANACSHTSDAEGCLPHSAHLCQTGPRHRHASIDTAAVCRHLAARGFPVSLSDDAGTYLCNAVLYHSLAAAGAPHAPPCRTGFIHIPADLSGPPLTFSMALEGALEIIRVCLDETGA